MGRVAFRYQKNTPTIFRVAAPVAGVPQAQYSTVQAAIDAAVLAGHTSNDNPATVEVYPGSYVESLTLKPGVNLLGVGNTGVLNSDGSGGAISINGNHTYSVSNGLSRTQNSITINGINLTCLNGVTLLFAGTSPAQMSIVGCAVQKQTGGDVNPTFRFTNTGAGSRFRAHNGSAIDNNTATSDAMDLQQGTTEMRDRNTTVFSSSGVTLRTAAKISNAAQLRVWSCDNWFTGNATQIIELVNNTSLFQIFHSLFNNNLAGGHGVLYTAAATARFRWTQIQINTNVAGYIGKNGGAGGTYQQGSNVIIGTNQQVQTGITINTDASSAVSTP